MAKNQRLEACLILMHQDRYVLAEEELGRILAEDPENNTAHEYMAWCMADQGRFKEAFNRANEAIRLAPEDAQPYYVKATCYTKQRKYQKSLWWFRRAIRLSPYTHFYYSDFSGALCRLERYPEALRIANKGLQMNPLSVECHNARTKALKAMGQSDEALESVEKTLTLDPENAKALHLKGNLLLWEWQWKEAQAAIRESLRIVPTNGEAAIDLRLIQILRVIRWPFLFSCISFWNFFDTHNAASLMAGVAFGFLIIFCADFVEAEGKLRKAMRIVAPFLITLGVLSVTFFSQAHPWYHDWAAWLFGTLFCSLCINPEKVYFSEERGFDLKAWAELVWPMILFVSLFFLNPAGVMLGLNGGLLITRFNWLNKTRPGRWFKFHRFLRFLSVPFIVWMAGSTYWDWQACTAWYGNGDVWGDEVAYFVLLVWLESGTPKEEKVNQPVSTKPLLEGNHE